MNISKELQKSRLYESLKWKYLEKKIKPFVFLALVIWFGFMLQIINALAYLQTRPIITL